MFACHKPPDQSIQVLQGVLGWAEAKVCHSSHLAHVPEELCQISFLHKGRANFGTECGARETLQTELLFTLSEGLIKRPSDVPGKTCQRVT